MIKSIWLTGFRNHLDKSFKFSKGTTVIVGDNAVGKTNILEALFLLSTGKSFKANKEGEMIGIGSEMARVSAKVVSSKHEVESEEAKLEAVITPGTNGWPKKRLLVNGIPKRMIDFAGQFKTVLFGPWDMDLVGGSPSIRRNFLNVVLSQIDREYRRSLLSYEKGVRQRNKLLYRIREGEASRSQLMFWDHLLIKNGDYISRRRKDFIDYVNAGNFQFPISNYQLEYDSSSISVGRLEQYKQEEVAAATTLVGPHRDDFVFLMGGPRKNQNLSSFGSRGEQRMGVLWLKMAELKFIEENTDTDVTLLLDDIFSELDHDHRDVVLDTIANHQVIMTTADRHFIPMNNEKLTMINL